MSCKSIIAAALLLAPVSAVAQNGTVEQRLERIEAEAEIRRMLVQYGAFLDARDFAAYANLFADDGEWIGGFGRFQGPAAIRKMLEDNLGAPEPGFVNKSNFHMLTNPLIEIDGDRAKVSSKYLFWTRSPEDRPTPLLAGRYVDEFVKHRGEWKLARRTTWGEIPYRDPNEPPAQGGGPAAAAAAAPSLEQRLRRAEDQLAIQRVITDYAARLDAQDFDGYAALFAKEGVWQTGTTARRGPAEIKAMLVDLFGTPAPGFVNAESYHLVSNMQVNVDGDRATARSRHLLVMRGENGSPRPALAGYYDDEFVRENGQWKIARRVDNPVMPTSEEWRREMAMRRPQQGD
jgi:ketosteroid isomerase-like protein